MQKRGEYTLNIGHEAVEQGKSVDTAVFLMVGWILMCVLAQPHLHQVVWHKLFSNFLKQVGQAEYLISLPLFTCSCKFYIY